MEKTIKINVRNNGNIVEVPMGSTLEDAYKLSGLELVHGAISARVNNKVEGMHYRIYKQKEVEFLDITSSSGIRAYTRTLFFILCKAAHELFDEPEGKPCKVRIDIPISNGYYVDLHLRRAVTPDDVNALRQKMQEIIDAAIPIHRFECTTEEAIAMFTRNESLSKVKLLKSTGRLYTTYYDIDGYQDYYYGSLLTNTSQIYLFGLEYYFDSLLLRIPDSNDPSRLGAFVRQDKMFGIFKEHHQWQDIINLRNVGDLNDADCRRDSQYEGH